jgi:hypothetical protein
LSRFGANVGTTAAGSNSQLTGGLGFSDSPTITFVPRADAAFQREFYAPLNFDRVVMGTLRGDRFDVELFTLLTAGINGAPDRDGPVGELYRKRIAAIAQLLTEYGTLGMRKSYDYISIVPIPREKVRARDHIWAAAEGQLFFEAPGGEGLLLGYRYLAALIKLIDPADEGAHDALRTLGLRPGLEAYEFNASTGVQVEGRGDENIWVSTRSLADVMGIVARNVEIPAELQESGVVPPLRYSGRTGSDVKFKLHASKREPETPFAVSSQGFWFYVDPSDHYSKELLSILNELFYAQVGSQPSTGGPILTLPLGTGQ